MSWRSQTRWLRGLEAVLFLAGFLCAGFCAFVAAESIAAARAGEALLRGEGLPGTALSGAAATRTPAANRDSAATVIGRLEIPAIALSVPILSDYESASLLQGIGHIPGTAMPGGLGTLGLAGHRDTYFRPLAKIKPEMEIRVADRVGTYHYTVDSTEIVKPEDVQVLDIRARPELTLITCYPFHYVGAAPLRFIVHAHLLSARPDPVD